MGFQNYVKVVGQFLYSPTTTRIHLQADCGSFIRTANKLHWGIKQHRSVKRVSYIQFRQPCYQSVDWNLQRAGRIDIGLK